MVTQTKIIISAEDKTKAALASVRNSLTGLSKEAATTAVGFTTLAGVLSGAGLVTFVKNGIDAIDMLGDLSDRTGISVENLSALKLVAKQSDTSIESLGSAINKLSIFMVKNADDAKKLGISAKDPLQAFIQLAGVIENIEDVQLRAAVAQKILGKSYEEVLPALLRGADGLQEMIDKGKENTLVTKEMQEEAGRFNDSMDELGLNFQQLAINIANPLLPELNKLIDRLREAYKQGGLFNSVMAGLNEGGTAGNVIGAAAGFKASGKVPILGKNPLFRGGGAVLGALLPEAFDDAGIVTSAGRPASGAPDLESSIKFAKSQLDKLPKTPENAKKIAELNKKVLELENRTETAAIAAKNFILEDDKAAEDAAKKSAKEAEADAKRRANEAKAEAKRRADEAKREAEALQKAEISLQETLRSNAAKFTEAQITAQADATRREYDAKLITAEQYYARLNVLEEQRAENQLRLLNQNLADQQAILNSNVPESEKTRARAEVSNINTEIALVQSNLQNLKAQAASDLATAQKDQLKTNFDAVKTRIDNALEDLRRREQQINDRVGLGLPEIAAEQQVNAVRKDTVQTVTALVQQLEAMAAANPKAFGADAARTIEDYKSRLQETTVVIDAMAVRINSEINNGFSTFFNDVITGTESVSDAFTKMLSNITNAIAQEASRQLGQQLFASIFGESVGAGGGFGSILSSLFSGAGGGFFGGATGGPLGFADGGYTGDCGKYQPKGIVHGGEFVFSKAATQNLGVGALAHLHALASGSFLPQGRRSSYAAGGLVDLPATAGAAQVNNTNIIAIDQSDVQNAAFGGGADKKILNIVNVNRAAFRSALGV